MRTLLALVAILSLAGEASARRDAARSLQVHGTTLQVSPALKRRIDDHQRLADWKGSFRRQDSSWLEATRFRRLRDGTSSSDLLHIGRKDPGPQGGQKWLVRLSQSISAPPPAPRAGAVTREARDALAGLGVSVVRAGPYLGSRVFGATRLPNGHTLEVAAELVQSKNQVRFEVLTWKGGLARGRVAPTGKFVIRDGSGRVVDRGEVRGLWRTATSPAAKARTWTSTKLGLSPEGLRDLLVDLTG